MPNTLVSIFWHCPGLPKPLCPGGSWPLEGLLFGSDWPGARICSCAIADGSDGTIAAMTTIAYLKELLEMAMVSSYVLMLTLMNDESLELEIK